MPSLNDPNFERTVTLICQHDDDGALGIVINRPIELSAAELLKQLDISTEPTVDQRATVYSGGPVQPELGLILHEHDDTAENFETMISISDELNLTMSIDVLEAIARNDGPDRALIALGYAGWGPGQLDAEMVQNAWLSVPASIDVIFNTPVSERWDAAARSIGVDIGRLSSQSGHA